jgi:hypothetical protein
MRHFTHQRIRHIVTRVLGAALGVAVALAMFTNVAAGHAYSWHARHLSPAACYRGCVHNGLDYYYRAGTWYSYAGGQWYYYNPCWRSWVSVNGGQVAVSASG